MKYQHAILLATAGLAAAKPHRHAHRHVHNIDKRDAAADMVYVKETKVVYMLDGQEIPEWEVKQGIENGTFFLNDGGHIEQFKPVTVAPTTTTSTSTPTPTPTPSSASSSSSSAAPVVMAEVKQSSSAAAPPAPSVVSAASSNNNAVSAAGYNADVSGLDTKFENGKVDCSHFPSEYGAMAIPWTGYGGWSGIQNPVDTGSCYTSIESPDHGAKGACVEGSYCSYACPPGYQKAAWPKKQGCKGESVGGLLCKGGKLYMPEGSAAETLCIKGDQNVKVHVKNQMKNAGAASCRTDYPGKEDQTVPVWADPGDTQPLCSNNQNTYYKGWNGVSYNPTSAQWYMNKKGISTKDACTWSEKDKETGNYAPTCVGTSYVPDTNAAFIGIAQNLPSAPDAVLDYTIELVAEPADKLNGLCAYIYDPDTKTGKYCSAKNGQGKWTSCNNKGCTGTVMAPATAYVVFRDGVSGEMA